MCDPGQVAQHGAACDSARRQSLQHVLRTQRHSPGATVQPVLAAVTCRGGARQPAGQQAPHCLQVCPSWEWSHLTASLLNSSCCLSVLGSQVTAIGGSSAARGTGGVWTTLPFFCAEDGGLPWTLGWGQPGHLCKFLGTMTPLHRPGTAGQGGPPAKPPGILAECLLCAGTQGCFTRVPWRPQGPGNGATTLRHMEGTLSALRRGTPSTRWHRGPRASPVGSAMPCAPAAPASPHSRSLFPLKLIGHCPARGDPFPLPRVDIQAQSCRGHLVPGPSQRPGPTSPPGGASGASLLPARPPQWPSPPA